MIPEAVPVRRCHVLRDRDDVEPCSHGLRDHLVGFGPTGTRVVAVQVEVAGVPTRFRPHHEVRIDRIGRESRGLHTGYAADLQAPFQQSLDRGEAELHVSDAGFDRTVAAASRAASKRVRVSPVGTVSDP
jgi:hypothetical protein